MLKKTVMAGAVAAALGSGLAQAAEPALATHAHRKRRLLQPVHLSRTDADQPRSGAAGRLRLQPLERLLRSAPGHRTSAGCATAAPTYARRQPGVGFLRRLQVGLRARLDATTWACSTTGIRATSAPGTARKADTFELYAGAELEVAVAPSTPTAVSNKTFGVRRRDGTYYLDFGLNVPLGDFSKEADRLDDLRALRHAEVHAADAGAFDQRHALLVRRLEDRRRATPCRRTSRSACSTPTPAAPNSRVLRQRRRGRRLSAQYRQGHGHDLHPEDLLAARGTGLPLAGSPFFTGFFGETE